MSRTAQAQRSRTRRSAATLPQSRVDVEVLQGLRKIIRAVDMHSKKLAGVHGVTGPQLIALHVLNDFGSITQREISQHMSVGGSTVTGIIDRLEAKKLAFRERDTIDRRKVFVSITKKGLKLIERAPSPLQETLAQKLETLSDREKRTISKSIHRIVDLMGIEGMDASPILAPGELAADKI